MGRLEALAATGIVVLAACLAPGAMSSSAAVKNRFLLTLKFHSTVRMSETHQCSDPSVTYTSSTVKRFYVHTRRPTPVWMGMLNMNPRHPHPPPPKRFLPIWGGIHGFYGYGPLGIRFQVTVTRSTQVQHCDGTTTGGKVSSTGHTRGDFSSTTFGHVGRMNLDIKKNVWDDYPAVPPGLKAKVAVKRMLAGATVRFGQEVRAESNSGTGKASVHAKWHAVVRHAG